MVNLPKHARVIAADGASVTERKLPMLRRGRVAPRLPTNVSRQLLERRWYGSLDVVTDSERRPLRPIGMTAWDAATRTGVLLAHLLAVPGIRIFLGIRIMGTDLPVIPHAVSSGQRLILVESVAWPPGSYELAGDGRIRCDGVYIGQSAESLITAMHAWREVLPRRHRVSAVVVVHPVAGEHATLPVATSNELVWAHPGDVVHNVRRLVRPSRAVRGRALAALVARSTGCP